MPCLASRCAAGSSTVLGQAIERALVAAIIAGRQAVRQLHATSAACPGSGVDAVPDKPTPEDVLAAVAKVLADLGHKPGA
jgi:hypothetical protein